MFGDSNVHSDENSCVRPKIISHALLTTFLLNNNPFSNGPAAEWERDAFIAFADDFNSFFTEHKIDTPSDSDSDLIRSMRELYKRIPEMKEV